MYLITQILGIVAFIIAVFSMLFQNKAKILFFIAIYNIIILTSYLLLGQYLGCILIGIETVRSIVYFVFTLKNIKPNLYIYILFNILIVFSSIIFWVSWVDVFMLISLLINTYTTWQTNVKIIKIGTIVSTVFYILYNIFVGAYFNIISEVAFGLTSFYSLLILLKKEKNTDTKII